MRPFAPLESKWSATVRRRRLSDANLPIIAERKAFRITRRESPQNYLNG